MLSKVVSLILCAAFVFNTTSAMAVGTLSVSNDHGSLVIKQQQDQTHFRSVYTAPNKVTLEIDAMGPNHFSAKFGRKQLEASRNANGDVHLVYRDGNAVTVRDISAYEMQAANPKDVPAALANSSFIAMSSDELEAFDSFVAFSKETGNSTVNSFGCIINAIATTLVIGGAVALCVESLGFACAGGVAGAFQSYESTSQACQ